MEALGVLFLSIAFPAYELALTGAFAAFTAYRALTMTGYAQLLHVSSTSPYKISHIVCSFLFMQVGVASFSAAVFAMWWLQSRGEFRLFVAGLGLAIGGFIPKVADVRDGVEWGTAAFHVLEAAGFASLFLWAQTLPLPTVPS